MTRLRGALFSLALALVVLAHLLVAAPSLLELRLWEDEAFNLTVPLNLLRGLGYTSDGTLSGSQLTPFDARISTGPVVLLPVTAALATGADLVLAGRAVMLVFYAALLAGLWIVGRRVGGRWAGLAAVSVPLALNTNGSASPLQGPADILGEIPAAALIVFALATFRSRPWLAGLLLGLAVQCKTIALLAFPALLLAVFFTEPGQTVRQRLRRTLPMIGMAVVPTALFELWQLVALGPAGFALATRNFIGFLVKGGQTGYFPPLDKLVALLSAWRLPLVVVVLVVIGAIALGVYIVRLARRGAICLPAGAGEDASPRELIVLLGAAAFGVLTWAAWWIASAHTPVWIRHPSPGLFAFLPVLAAYVVLALRVLLGAPQARPRIVAAVGAVALAAVLVLPAAVHASDARAGRHETLGDQRAAAAGIAAVHQPWLAGAWGGSVSVTVMSGAHAALTDAPQVGDTTRIWSVRDHPNRAAFDEWLGVHCGRELLATHGYVVCAAPPG
ncbi:hypothetical protein [Cryobacterium tagatosivorans]|uniref:DUF2029 domain-containing protein n=1 Tax=Cryobacterium tagatosivorans TaxID=1259199 RepID=A0A4R8UCG0_9MICO|nr:hypothetical protein [Cryobacterium tagatosivorans]TFB47800.1 hypothetical protein E3O23_14420 [Cryobacterium tagatosivorans]